MPESGLAEARNAGCLLARWQYIAIIDADDVCVGMVWRSWKRLQIIEP